MSHIPQISENSNNSGPKICALWLISHIWNFSWDNRNGMGFIIYDGKNNYIYCQIIWLWYRGQNVYKISSKYGQKWRKFWERRSELTLDRAPWVHIAWRHLASDQPLPKNILSSIGIYMWSASNFIKSEPPNPTHIWGGGSRKLYR